MTATQGLALAALSERCKQESARYQAGMANDPSFCLEIFRRALQQRVDDAWAAIVECFTPQMRAWFHRHPRARVVAPDGDGRAFIDDAFAGLFMANARNSLAVDSLPGMLRYLHACLHTSIMTAARQAARAVPLSALAGADERTPEPADPAAGPDDQAIGEVQARELAARLLGCARDARERRLIDLRWFQHYRPAEIAERFPEDFPDARSVYQMLANLLARFRRRYGSPGGA